MAQAQWYDSSVRNGSGVTATGATTYVTMNCSGLKQEIAIAVADAVAKQQAKDTPTAKIAVEVDLLATFIQARLDMIRARPEREPFFTTDDFERLWQRTTRVVFGKDKTPNVREWVKFVTGAAMCYTAIQSAMLVFCPNLFTLWFAFTFVAICVMAVVVLDGDRVKAIDQFTRAFTDCGGGVVEKGIRRFAYAALINHMGDTGDAKYHISIILSNVRHLDTITKFVKWGLEEKEEEKKATPAEPILPIPISSARIDPLSARSRS